MMATKQQQVNLTYLALAILSCINLSFTLFVSVVNQPSFTGNIQVTKSKLSPDSLRIQFVKPNSPLGTVTSKAYATADRHGDFNFKLPKFAQPIKMIINITHRGKSRRINDGYLVEPTDNIRIEIREKQGEVIARFSGHGAEKYNIVNQLDSLVREFNIERSELQLYSAESYANKLLQFEQLTAKYEYVKGRLLNKSGLSMEIRKMINYEYANFFSLWDGALYQYKLINFKNETKIKDLIVRSFNKNKDRFGYRYDPLMAQCRNYIFATALREGRDLVINSPDKLVDVEDFYKKITIKYAGKFRERLIANFFIGSAGLIQGFNIDQSVLDSLMLDAEKYITVPSVKKTYSDKLRLGKGKKIFDGSFYDINNTSVSLSSFRGKVILLDLWAVGCSWCAIFHESFHKNIFPTLKNNKDFVYISLNTDSSRERWLEGLKSNLYTSSDYVNVYTNGLGTDHEFTKYYHIQSLPFMVLIDKNGNIHSTNIGKPEQAVLMIENLLVEKD